MTALSLRGLARLMGVSAKAVRNALGAGVFSPAAIARDASGLPTVLDAALAVAEWERSGRHLRGTASSPPAIAAAPLLPAGLEPAEAVPDASTEIAALLGRVRQLREGVPGPAAGAPDALTGEDASKDPTLVQAQRDAMLERGRKLRLENDQREGLLLEAAVAAREAFDFARVLREAVLNIPARLSAELAAETDAARVYLRLDGALREALEATAWTLEQAPVASAGEGASGG